MKKHVLALLLALQLLCGSVAHAITFTDDLGHTVTVENPRRVAALLGSFAQVWQLAGGDVIATADDAWEDLALPMAADAVNLGGTKTMSLETLLSVQPDFIIASASTTRNLDWRPLLTGAGIPVAYFDVQGFEDYLRLLRICTDVTGRADLYDLHGLQVQQQIDGVIARSRSRLQGQEPPTVLCLVASASYMKAKNSEGSVLGSMLQGLGCINIADSNTLLLENLSMEYILAADPDHIFVVQRGDDAAGMRAYVEQHLLSSPVWQQLSAVREGRVHLMDKNLFNLKPNHRWGEAYGILEDILSDEED